MMLEFVSFVNRIMVTLDASITEIATVITNVCLIHHLSKEKNYDLLYKGLFII